jgi:hypothetical protein
VVLGKAITLFTPNEVQTLICGGEHLNFEDLQEITEYEGYDENSPEIKFINFYQETFGKSYMH